MRQDARSMDFKTFSQKYKHLGFEHNAAYHTSKNEVNAHNMMKDKNIGKKGKHVAQQYLDAAKVQDILDKQIITIKNRQLGKGGSSYGTGGSNYGCQALLCFAGGMHVAECRSTIRKVLRDLWKGRGFPTCIGYNGRVNAGTSRIIFKASQSPKIKTINYFSTVYCPDGKTIANRISYRKDENFEDRKYACNKIEINIPKNIASDKQHQKQIYYFNPYQQ